MSCRRRHPTGSAGAVGHNVYVLSRAAKSDSSEEEMPPYTIEFHCNRMTSSQPTTTPESGDLVDAIYLRKNAEKLMRSSDYVGAIEYVRKLRACRPDSLYPLVMMRECLINSDKFQDAYKFFIKKLKPAVLREFGPDARHIIAQSQNCVQSGKFLKSHAFLWCASDVYNIQPASRQSLEGIQTCVQYMEELLLSVFEKHGESESQYCVRFAHIHVLHLKQQKNDLEKFYDTGNDALRTEICMRLSSGIASCYLLLKEYGKSNKYFRQCITLSGDDTGVNKLRLGPVGDFVSHVAKCYTEADEELQDITKLISETRQDIVEYDATDESDAALKDDLFRLMDNFTTDIQNAEEHGQRVISNLLRLNFRR